MSKFKYFIKFGFYCLVIDLVVITAVLGYGFYNNWNYEKYQNIFFYIGMVIMAIDAFGLFGNYGIRADFDFQMGKTVMDKNDGKDDVDSTTESINFLFVSAVSGFFVFFIILMM
ncbi:hypothetical protein EDD72_102255 [Tepidibacillus fermentans]|uniref:DUF3899 domain-containing protein n=1 Tax=Tepidibacillus fermentans TaxID=1281767 RepID=A0A4R3KK84_9BACI|nr:hypothetical protein EDD72_102255 [Tepidibacillus fermentans]